MDNANSDKLCICDIVKRNIVWINNNINSSYQICLEVCPDNYRLDEITHICHECNPKNDYVFNNICYLNDCPKGTQLDKSNLNSKICICEESSIIDKETGLIVCVEAEYPPEFFENRINCPFIYKGKCFKKCPENTCLTQEKEDLTKCVDIKKNMKIINGICFEGLEEIVKNIENFEPITSSCGITINIFPLDKSIDELIKSNYNLTFVDFGECSDKLKEAYNLPTVTQLFLLGIDIPNLNEASSINSFNYEIYLKNGTQLKDLSACDDTKII